MPWMRKHDVHLFVLGVKTSYIEGNSTKLATKFGMIHAEKSSSQAVERD